MRRYPFASKLLRLGYLGRRHAGNCNLTVTCRNGIALASRQVEPHVREHVILRHSFPFTVHPPKAVLGTGMALLGSKSEPARSLGEILRYALSSSVYETEAALGVGIALLG